MKKLARFIKRGRNSDGDSLGILSLFKDGQDKFEEDTIYEIVEVMDSFIIKKIGKTHLDPCEWNHEIGEVTSLNPCLTEEEYNKILLDMHLEIENEL